MHTDPRTVQYLFYTLALLYLVYHSSPVRVHCDEDRLACQLLSYCQTLHILYHVYAHPHNIVPMRLAAIKLIKYGRNEPKRFDSYDKHTDYSAYHIV